MGTTANFAFPYPEDSDPPDGASQIEALATAVDTSLDAHIDDTTAAHAASAISFTPTGSIASTNVQAAIAEIGTDLTPACRVYHNAAQSIASGSFVPLTFNSERFDTDNMHSTVTNPGRITFTTAGLYLVGGNIEFAGNAVGTRGMAILHSGTTYIASILQDIDAATTHELNISAVYAFTAGQYVELWAGQTSGGALNVNSGPQYSPEFWAARIGRVV